MRGAAPALALLVLLPGCDTLFPEFAGSRADMAMPADAQASDGGGSSRIAGAACVLGDAREYRSCTSPAAGVRVTAEETGDVALADANGRFTLQLARPLAAATLKVTDPRGVLHAAVLPIITTTLSAIVSVPLVSEQTFAAIQATTGFVAEPRAGALLSYAVNVAGVPVAGARATLPGAGAGPFYDGAQAGFLDPLGPTRQHGLMAFFNAPPGSVTVQVTTPPSAPVRGDQFVLPLRAGAITISLLFLFPATH